MTYYTRIRFDAITVRPLLLEATCTDAIFCILLPIAVRKRLTYFVLAGFRDLSEQFGKSLAWLGCRLVIPTLIDRTNTYAGNTDIGRWAKFRTTSRL